MYHETVIKKQSVSKSWQHACIIDPQDSCSQQYLQISIFYTLLIIIIATTVIANVTKCKVYNDLPWQKGIVGVAYQTARNFRC